MQTPGHGGNIDPDFSATLQKFGALSRAEQLPILAYALRQELNAAPIHPRLLQPAGVRASPRRAGTPRRGRTPRGADASAPAARPTARTLVLTMSGSFALAFAVMLWERQEGELVFPVAPPATAPDPEVARAPAAVSQPAVADPSTTSPPVTPRAPNTDPQAMPVSLQFRRRGFHSDPADRRKINWFTEGRVTNHSDDPLVIAVRVDGPGTLSAAQIQLSVPAHSDRDFGKDDGLEMHPGDRVTLVSPPYADLVVGGVR